MECRQVSINLQVASYRKQRKQVSLTVGNMLPLRNSRTRAILLGQINRLKRREKPTSLYCETEPVIWVS